MLIGYARTSTIDQQAGFEAQLKELKAYGCERIFQEQVSAVASRQELERAIDILREGDKLVVTKLDRLARNVTHMGELLQQIEASSAVSDVGTFGTDLRLCWFRVSCSSLLHEGCDEPEILRYENLKSVPKVPTSDTTGEADAAPGR